MPSHSNVIIKFSKSLETKFLNRLKQKPNWDADEIEIQFIRAQLETLAETIDEVMEKFHNLFKGVK